MQDCMRKVETKAVMTVRMKLPIFSALGILKIFMFVINFNFNNLVMQGDTLLVNLTFLPQEGRKNAGVPCDPPSTPTSSS